MFHDVWLDREALQWFTDIVSISFENDLMWKRPTGVKKDQNWVAQVGTNRHYNLSVSFQSLLLVSGKDHWLWSTTTRSTPTAQGQFSSRWGMRHRALMLPRQPLTPEAGWVNLRKQTKQCHKHSDNQNETSIRKAFTYLYICNKKKANFCMTAQEANNLHWDQTIIKCATSPILKHHLSTVRPNISDFDMETRGQLSLRMKWAQVFNYWANTSPLNNWTILITS